MIPVSVSNVLRLNQRIILYWLTSLKSSSLIKPSENVSNDILTLPQNKFLRVKQSHVMDVSTKWMVDNNCSNVNLLVTKHANHATGSSDTHKIISKERKRSKRQRKKPKHKPKLWQMLPNFWSKSEILKIFCHL